MYSPIESGVSPLRIPQQSNIAVIKIILSEIGSCNQFFETLLILRQRVESRYVECLSLVEFRVRTWICEEKKRLTLNIIITRWKQDNKQVTAYMQA